MANIILSGSDSSGYDELMGGKKKAKKGKKKNVFQKLKTGLKKRKEKKLMKLTGKKSLSPAQKKKIATIQALPLGPLAKKTMMAKVIKGKPKKAKGRKMRTAGRKAGTTAASIATGGLIGLIAKRVKKSKAKKKAAASRKKEAASRVTKSIPDSVAEMKSVNTFIPEEQETDTEESPVTVESAQNEIMQNVEAEEKNETGNNKMLPILAAAGLGAFLLLNKKK